MSYGGWPRYVSVAERRVKAEKRIKRLMKKGQKPQPIQIEGRKITKSFWGNAWCSHLEQFSDFSNRLPRGRSYVKNGSVCHLEIQKTKIKAMVSGSTLYNVTIDIKALPQKKWDALKHRCAGSIGSMLELLQGKLSSNIMEIVTDTTSGLFPGPEEIELNCDCPDWATMCKHVAAVLYGAGSRLDHSPELLFLLRNVDHEELITTELNMPAQTSRKRRVVGELSSIFDVELSDTVTSATQPKRSSSRKKLRNPRSSKKEAVSGFPDKITAKDIQNLRKKWGMNATEFAKMLKVNPQTIRNWENKKGTLNLQRSKRIALEKAWREF